MTAGARFARVRELLRRRAGFQTKVVLTIVPGTLVPLIAMLALNQGFLTTTITQGLNPGIEADLGRGFHARRELLETMKQLFARHADVLVLDVRDALAAPRDDAAPPRDEAATREALRVVLERHLDSVATLAQAQVLAADGTVLVDARRSPRLGHDRRTRVERRPLPAATATSPAPALLVATFSTEWERFREFERAGQHLRLYSVLRRTQIPAMLVGVLKAQIAILPVAVFASIVLTWWVARSVTRRVKLLAIATSRVGQGDLSVRVRPRGSDELDDLIRAFNGMVEDMQLSRSRIEYLQRIGAWQDFARRLAHEIKNPLTPIQLAIQEVAKKYSGDDATFKKTLQTAREVIEEEVETLRRLVAAFSAFARLPDVKTAPGDLAEFVRDAGENQAFLDEAASGVTGTRHGTVDLVFQPGDAPISVRIDRILMRRALDNLVRNAVQAGAKQVRIRAERHDDEAWLIVEDDGPGIPEDKRARVFDPYYTTKEEGTGLGLAIVRKLAFDHNGDVGLEESPSGGARFIVTLPVATPGRETRLSFVTFSGSKPRPQPPTPMTRTE
jgi:two-component system nitrogen regulation sensor histidine kinase NtrY